MKQVSPIEQSRFNYGYILETTSGTSQIKGNAIDTQGFEYALVIFSTGTISGTSDVAYEIQSCSTSGGTYAAISGASLTITAASTTWDKQIRWGVIRLHGKDRYLKVCHTPTADAQAAPIHVHVILCNALDTAFSMGVKKSNIAAAGSESHTAAVFDVA